MDTELSAAQGPGLSLTHVFSSLKNLHFMFRCMYMLVWGKFVLYKYVTCWLVTVRRQEEPGS